MKTKSIRELAEMITGGSGNAHVSFPYFQYRSSYYLNKFFQDCNLAEFVHDGSSRISWVENILTSLLQEPSSSTLPLSDKFIRVLQELMDKREASDDDPNRSNALEVLNKTLRREGYEAFYGEDDFLYLKHLATKNISVKPNPHRPFTQLEIQNRNLLNEYLNKCSEDELIEEILLPLFRQLGYQRISVAGHKDKALEYGKDIWMKFTLPSQHILYFGLQVKKGKLDSAGISKSGNANVAEIYNQALMMLGHEIFDPETSRKVLVDHAFIVAGGEITKQAKNWLGEKLDTSKRSQILFMDRDDILNLYVTSNLSLPVSALPKQEIIINDNNVPF